VGGGRLDRDDGGCQTTRRRFLPSSKGQRRRRRHHRGSLPNAARPEQDMHQRSGNPETMATRRTKHSASRVAGPNPCALRSDTPKHRARDLRASVDQTEARNVADFWPGRLRRPSLRNRVSRRLRVSRQRLFPGNQAQAVPPWRGFPATTLRRRSHGAVSTSQTCP